MNPIPLFLPDLDPEMESLLLAQIKQNPFHDPDLLLQWEMAWSRLWDMGAVAFAKPGELFALLAKRLPLEQGILLDPLLPPVFRETLSGLGIPFSPANLDPMGRPLPGPGLLLTSHAQSGDPLAEIPVISSTILPREPGSWPFLIAMLDANQPVPAGGTSLLLVREPTEEQWFRRNRQFPPSALALRLGLASLHRFQETLPRRQFLAKNYAAVRTRNLLTIPPCQARGGFLVSAHSRDLRERLHAFLMASAIGSACPLPWPTPLPPGAQSFMDTALFLPFYPGLRDPEQKRVINRLHRFLEREQSRDS